MKNLKFLSLAMLLGGMLFFSNLQAQPPHGERGPKMEGKMCRKGGHHGHSQMMGMFKDLTEDQKTKMKAIRTKFAKETNPLRAKLDILKSQKKAEMISDNPSMDKINGYIDEIMKLKTSISKKKAEQAIEMRKILNDDQRAIFDQHLLNKRR